MERSLLIVGVSAQISVLIPIALVIEDWAPMKTEVSERSWNKRHLSLLFYALQNRTISGERNKEMN